MNNKTKFKINDLIAAILIIKKFDIGSKNINFHQYIIFKELIAGKKQVDIVKETGIKPCNVSLAKNKLIKNGYLTEQISDNKRHRDYLITTEGKNELEKIEYYLEQLCS
jgi:DNA-binding MarR family transcriptional regulator